MHILAEESMSSNDLGYERLKGPPLPPVLKGCPCQDCTKFRATQAFKRLVEPLIKSGLIRKATVTTTERTTD